jgi:hypothetical protein
MSLPVTRVASELATKKNNKIHNVVAIISVKSSMQTKLTLKASIIGMTKWGTSCDPERSTGTRIFLPRFQCTLIEMPRLAPYICSILVVQKNDFLTSFSCRRPTQLLQYRRDPDLGGYIQSVGQEGR